jgi:hypothetical protein
MARRARVERPTKKNEYELRFGSASAEKGWNDLKATMRNALADSWDFLTRTPTLHDASKNHPLRGELGTVRRDGVDHVRWQHKPTAQGDARIWFYVEGQVVIIEAVHTRHPNATK